MGTALMSDTNNDSLVDNLIGAKHITCPRVERVFRAVDRGFYYTKDQRQQAYSPGRAWKLGNLHLSTPRIYATVVEALELKPGNSFLNLGSGTGYLNTMAGLLIGPVGLNHGIEIHPEVVAYAEHRLEKFRTTPAVDKFDFSKPSFQVGNCLSIPTGFRRYDRVYCGAGCSVNWKQRIESFLKVGGILIAPVEDQMLKITRRSETLWESTKLISVIFAPLVPPRDDESKVTLCTNPEMDRDRDLQNSVVKNQDEVVTKTFDLLKEVSKTPFDNANCTFNINYTDSRNIYAPTISDSYNTTTSDSNNTTSSENHNRSKLEFGFSFFK